MIAGETSWDLGGGAFDVDCELELELGLHAHLVAGGTICPANPEKVELA